jgi:hypothetical protein
MQELYSLWGNDSMAESPNTKIYFDGVNTQDIESYVFQSDDNMQKTVIISPSKSDSNITLNKITIEDSGWGGADVIVGVRKFSNAPMTLKSFTKLFNNQLQVPLDSYGWSDFTSGQPALIVSLTKKTAAPVANPPASTYTTLQTVTLSTSTAGAIIRYTTDGTIPNDSSPQYATPIAISQNTTLKAIAIKSGMRNSNVMNKYYAIKADVPPTYSLANFISAINNWLQAGDPISDVNGDQTVNTKDLGMMMSSWIQ